MSVSLPAEVGISLCVSFCESKGSGRHQRWSPIWGKIAPLASRGGVVEIFTLKDVDGEIQLMYTFMQITWAKLFSFQWSIQLSKRLSTAAGTALLLAGAFAPNACKRIHKAFHHSLMCTSKLIFHMYKLQACSKSHGDKIQQILLAAYWCLLHSHLDEEPHQESLPPGQGKAWEGLPGAPKGQCQTNSTPASGKRGRWGGGGRISCWSPPVIFFMLYCEAGNIFMWSQGIWLAFYCCCALVLSLSGCETIL